MKKTSWVVTGVFLLTAVPVIANDIPAASVKSDKASAQAPAAANLMNDVQRKQVLGAQIQELQQLEVRVIVLQQLLSEQVSTLRQKEALFCDIQKLDVEKWRKSGYQLNNKTGTFSEKPVEVKK